GGGRGRGVGTAGPVGPSRRPRERRVVPRVRPVGVRHRDDRARRRRYVRGRRVVPDGGRRMDQPAASTLTVPELALEPWPKRLWRTYVTDVRAAANARATVTRATDRQMVIRFVVAA